MDELELEEQEKEEKPKRPYSEIRFLIDRYYSIQEHRIAMQLQIIQCEKENIPVETVKYYHQQFHTLEKDIEKHIGKVVKKHPLWKNFLKDVKGIGPVIAASFIAHVDIAKCTHASSLWRYCGLAVDLNTGRAERLTKGKKISWNPFMKTVAWKIGESFIKTKGKYRTIYDTSKQMYQAKFPTEAKDGNRKLYTKGHIHAMAKRRAVKLFLDELYRFWRAQEGLPVSIPFAERIGVHTP